MLEEHTTLNPQARDCLLTLTFEYLVPCQKCLKCLLPDRFQKADLPIWIKSAKVHYVPLDWLCLCMTCSRPNLLIGPIIGGAEKSLGVQG